MSDLKSQEAIDQFIDAVSSSEAAMKEASAPSPQRKVKIYDFKRPDKFSKDQIITVSIMHETFARLATTALSSQLRSLAHARVLSVDQLTYEEFIRSIPNPTTIAVIGMEPLKGPAVIEIDPAVSFAIIERLFGGTGQSPALARELTDVEKSVMEGTIDRLLDNLREAWTTFIDLRPRLMQIEVNPMFAQIVPPPEMIVLVTLEAAIGDIRGMINIAFPYITIEPIIPKLSAQYVYSSLRRRSGDVQELGEATGGLEVPAEVYVEGARISLGDLGRLRKGSKVWLPEYGQRKAFLRVGSRTLFGMKIRPEGRGRHPVYDVVERPAAGSLTFLTAQSAKGGLTDVQALESGMRGALRELSSEIGATLSGMKATIGALQQKQDEMADQLAFGPREPAFAETRRDLEHLRPFDLLRRADPGHLLGLLQQEHPQLVALVLSYLEPQMASGILGDLPPELQPDVARRIAGMDRTSPEVLRAVERVLEMRLSVRTSEDYTAAGGTEGLVEILGAASRSTERRVVESLEKIDPELAEDISRRMFVFEDIVLLDRRAADAVVGRTETETLLRALKGVPPEVQSFIWESVPREDVPRLRKRLQEMGPVRLYEVEKAQQTIVATIRDLEEAGEIIVARPGEPPKVVE